MRIELQKNKNKNCVTYEFRLQYEDSEYSFSEQYLSFVYGAENGSISYPLLVYRR